MPIIQWYAYLSIRIPEIVASCNEYVVHTVRDHAASHGSTLVASIATVAPDFSLLVSSPQRCECDGNEPGTDVALIAPCQHLPHTGGILRKSCHEDVYEKYSKMIGKPNTIIPSG